MQGNFPPDDNKKPTTAMANDPRDLKGTLKRIGGSQSDYWNNVLGNQALQSLWISDEEARDRQYNATIAEKCPAFARKVVLTKRIVWFDGPKAAPSFNHAWYIWDWKHRGSPMLAYAGLFNRAASEGTATYCAENRCRRDAA